MSGVYGAPKLSPKVSPKGSPVLKPRVPPNGKANGRAAASKKESPASPPIASKATPTPISSQIAAFEALAAATTPRSPALSPSAVVSAMSVEEPPKFEPLFVRVKNGVAQIIGRVGDTLIYVETEVSELVQSAKVWVMGMVETASKRVAPYLEGPTSKVIDLYLNVKIKAGSKIGPIYTKVVDGTIYVQGTVNGYAISIKAKATDVWTTVVARCSEKYNLARQAAVARIEPAWLWANAKYAIAQEKVVTTCSPYWTKAKDGCMYVQMKVGNTVVYIRTGVQEYANRVSCATLALYQKAYNATSPYFTPIIERAVAMYQRVQLKLKEIFGPILAKAKNGLVDAKVAILGLSARVRVRATTAREAISKFSTECYVKFKNGFVYVQGFVGNTLVSIKVRVSDIVAAVNVKLMAIRAEAQAQLLAATQYAKTKSAALSTNVRAAVKDQKVQVTAVSAVSGGVALGASGGATGLVAGGTIGAACGVVPAIFTFGLSIPIGAALGGVTGLCVGTVTGGAVGAVGGGAAGHYKDALAAKASGCKDFVADKTLQVKTKIVGGTTGGTA